MNVRELKTENEAGNAFREWADQFSGEFFMMLTVYADETGTQGIQRNGNEPAPGIYGIIGSKEDWLKFFPVWEGSLRKFKAPHFHFRELHPRERKELESGTFSYRRRASSGHFSNGSLASLRAEPIH